MVGSAVKPKIAAAMLIARLAHSRALARGSSAWADPLARQTCGPTFSPLG
jgi:hypothetical protein